MERSMTEPARRWRVGLTLAILAVVAAGLYGATILRFGVMLGGGP